jgi:hypothetical protein
MSSRQSNILIFIQILLTTICLFVAALLIPQSGYSATEILSDSATPTPPPPPPRAEHAPSPRYGYVWAQGHWGMATDGCALALLASPLGAPIKVCLSA